MSAKRGRPAKAPGEAKASMFAVRLTPAERAAVADAARRAGKRVTEWAREILLASTPPPRAQLAPLLSEPAD